MSDPPNRRSTSCPSPLSWTTSHTSPHWGTHDPTGSYIYLPRPGRHPTQTSHPGGVEVHIKVDYRVDEERYSEPLQTHHLLFLTLRCWHHPRVGERLWTVCFSFSLWSQTEQNLYSTVESQLIVLKQHDVKIGILCNLAPAQSQHIPEHQSVSIWWTGSETQKSTFLTNRTFKLKSLL